MIRRAMLLVTASLALIAARPSPEAPDGLWLNPAGTVAVRVASCGARLCGWIAWAAPEARADAREAGVDRLTGTELLRGYRHQEPGLWTGTVYVPDMGRSFPSTIRQVRPAVLRIKGCLLDRLICRSQDWRLIDQVPHA